jgi:predicted O-linked N-acetylglucosamine transferase (SPINDLY family)
MSTIAETFAQAVRQQQAGHLAEAERLYRQILHLDPQHADALHQLGRLAMQAGQYETAVQLIRQAMRSGQRAASYSISLAEAHRQLGQVAEAIAELRRALAIDPQSAAAHANLGVACFQAGDLAQAVASFREVTRLRPQDAQAFANLGRVQYDLGEREQAEKCFRRAAMLAPQNARAHYSLGSVLQSLGKLNEACDCYRAALTINPDDAEAHNNLGILLKELRRPAEAEAHYREALRIQPTYAAALNNLAVALGDQERHDEAVAACRRALELDPQSSAAYANLAGFLHGLGRVDEALENYRRAIALNPDDAVLHSNLLYVMNYQGDITAESLASEHRAWGRRHADPWTAHSGPLANDRHPARRLRVGYVSAFFRQHAVNFFVEPILAAHEHAAYEVYCYSDVAAADATTQRLQGYADHWRPTLGLSDQQVADLVRQDQIDLLVDLTGHILGGNRLGVFARRSAPVQVTYIGYQNTTGMTAMDYRLTDAYADPPGTTEAHYSETLWRLPGSFFCYLPSSSAPAIGPSAASRQGYVTLGSVNHFGKISSRVLAAWASILQAVPESRLLLLAPRAESVRSAVSATFQRTGVDPGRIEFVGRQAHEEYLRLLNRIDIGLDPFPFNGHTTTCDCLWMGVPVVMLAGATYVSRFGGTALVNLELESLISQSVDQYVDIAVRLANDATRLEALHADLRQRMGRSLLVDGARFTRNLEAAYRQMWTRWCQQQGGLL